MNTVLFINGRLRVPFRVDRLSLGVGTLVAIYLLVTIYSAAYITTYRLKYYVLLILNFCSLLGLKYSLRISWGFTFFEFYHSPHTFSSSTHVKRKLLEAGYKYIVMMLVGGLCILTAIWYSLCPAEGIPGALSRYQLFHRLFAESRRVSVSSLVA